MLVCYESMYRTTPCSLDNVSSRSWFAPAFELIHIFDKVSTAVLSTPHRRASISPMSRRSPVLGCPSSIRQLLPGLVLAGLQDSCRQYLVTVLFALSYEYPIDNRSVTASCSCRPSSTQPSTMLVVVLFAPQLEPLDNAQPRSCFRAAPSSTLLDNARMDLFLAIHRASRQCLVAVLFSPPLECHPTPDNAHPVLFAPAFEPLATASVSGSLLRFRPTIRVELSPASVLEGVHCAGAQ